MPGVKKLHQDSEDSSKGEYIFGHLFGAVGAVISKSAYGGGQRPLVRSRTAAVRSE